MLGRLDALLSEEQRRSSPEELGRYRLAVGAILFLLAVDVSLVVTAPLFPASRARMVVGLLSGSGWVVILVLLRRWSSPRGLGLLVCGLITAGLIAATIAMPDAPVSSHMVTMLVPAMAVYLAGVRAGLALTGFFCLNGAVLVPLLRSGFGSRYPLFSDLQPWMAGGVDALILLLGWALSALFCSSRDVANATVRESERKLSSLIESTDDPLCSLDLEGRIVTINSAARRLFQEAFGRAPRAGDTLDAWSSSERRAEWRDHLAQALQGRPVRYEFPFRVGARTVVLDLSLHPILGEGGRPEGVTVFGRDVTERKAAEVRLGELHRHLLEASRRAGMAEVATGVLHNVGNTLNSVNVSASLVIERLRGSRMPMLERAVDLLKEHAEDLPAFLAEDAKGRQLPDYFSSVTRHLTREHAALLEEMQALTQSVEHIKAVVSMQQENARFAGVLERVPVAQLLDDALRLHSNGFERLGIRIHREYTELPPVLVDRHKLLQILVNLLSNARHALLESGREDKLLTLCVRPEGEDRVCVEVRDNGVGIAPEHLSRLFVHGFTTKKDGHGFGLHASALAAEELDGRLSCTSGGPGQGATFIIELPLRGQEARA